MTPAHPMLPSPVVQTWLWAVAACAAFVVAVATEAPAPIAVALPAPVLWVTMATATAWTEVGYVRLPSAPIRATTPATSYTAVAQTVAVLILPAALALPAIALGSVAGQLIDRRRPLQIAFNACLHTASAAVAAAIVHVGPGDKPASLLLLAAWLTSSLAYEVLTWIGVGAVAASATGTRLRTVLQDTWTGAGTNMALTAITATLLQFSWLHALLGLTPSIGIRRAYEKMSDAEQRAHSAGRERDLFEQTVSGVSDVVLLCRLDGRIELASPASERLIGVSAEDVARNISFDAAVDLRDRDGRPVPFNHLLDLRRGDGRAADADLVLHVAADGGGERQVRVSVSAQAGLDGALAAAVIVLHDRTDDHELSKMKDEFVARVSHELRTPLTPIITYSQLLTRFRSGMDGDMVQESAVLIHERSQHMLAMIEDLLQVSKIAAGEQMSVQQERLELIGVVTDVAADVAMQYPEHRLLVDGPAEVGMVADPGQVRQVLANLLTNACKYSPAGPVEVSVRCTGGLATVDVRDHGAGIAKADRERIFAQFERLPATAASAAGTGVGLHIARNLARSLGGDLTLHRSGPAGSTFRWAVPRRLTDAGTNVSAPEMAASAVTA